MRELELPDTSAWKPTKATQNNVYRGFLERCQFAEEQIRARAEQEKKFNINNFDSGLGVEDIIRDELSNILPSRYSVRCGTINDRHGMSAGDADVVIFNDHWFPVVKFGATPESRKFQFPIEGVYAVGEIKQTLDEAALDAAMRKLVICHRLERPQTMDRRLVENRESSSCKHGRSNPLYSFILATDLSPNTNFENLINRFYDINRSVKRLEVVRCLCVLGHGAVVWGFRDEERQQVRPALFMLEDLYTPIVPVYHRPISWPPLFSFLSNLLLHLYHSVLAAEDIAAAYGGPDEHVQVPTSLDIALEPDVEMMDSLLHPCSEEHTNKSVYQRDRRIVIPM